MTYEIRVASTYDRKSKMHRARAFVLETFGAEPLKHNITVAMDVDRDVAVAEAVGYIRNIYLRDQDAKSCPDAVVDAGKIRTIDLETLRF